MGNPDAVARLRLLVQGLPMDGSAVLSRRFLAQLLAEIPLTGDARPGALTDGVLIQRFLEVVDGLSCRRVEEETGVGFATVWRMRRQPFHSLKGPTRERILTYLESR